MLDPIQYCEEKAYLRTLHTFYFSLALIYSPLWKLIKTLDKMLLLWAMEKYQLFQMLEK
jgi:hypothetical protein